MRKTKADLEKEVKLLTKKVNSLNQKLDKKEAELLDLELDIEAEWGEKESAVNESEIYWSRRVEEMEAKLLGRIAVLENENAALNGEIENLENQVRDEFYKNEQMRDEYTSRIEVLESQIGVRNALKKLMGLN